MRDSEALDLKIKVQQLEEMLFAVSSHLLHSAEISKFGEYHDSTMYEICRIYLRLKWDERDKVLIPDKVKRELFYDF